MSVAFFKRSGHHNAWQLRWIRFSLVWINIIKIDFQVKVYHHNTSPTTTPTPTANGSAPWHPLCQVMADAQMDKTMPKLPHSWRILTGAGTTWLHQLIPVKRESKKQIVRWSLTDCCLRRAPVSKHSLAVAAKAAAATATCGFRTEQR